MALNSQICTSKAWARSWQNATGTSQVEARRQAISLCMIEDDRSLALVI